MATGVYLIENTQTGSLYVGSAALSVDLRRSQHWYSLRRGVHENQRLQRAWDKYGEGAFRLDLLEELEPEFCVGAEQWWINSLRPSYNILWVAGSSRGRKMSPEARHKMALAKLGKPQPQETIEKRATSHRGKRRSPDAVSRMAAAQNRPETQAKIRAARIGYTHSPETRAKIGAANKGKVRTPETIAKLSAASRARWAKDGKIR